MSDTTPAKPIRPTDAAIRDEVRRILAEALSISVDSIRSESRIMDDLNAESIDLLDIRFRVEKAFAFRITAEDLAQAFQSATSAAEFRAQFTVDALCRYVSYRISDVP